MLGNRTRSWILACPLLFLLHEAEEYKTMLPWIAEHRLALPDSLESMIPRSPAFIAYAGVIFLVVYAIAGVMAIRSRPQSIAWLILAILLVARAENALLHIIESIVLVQYTPGLMTAVFLVLPIAIYLLGRLIKLDLIRKSWLPGIALAGFVVQSAAIGILLLFGSATI